MRKRKKSLATLLAPILIAGASLLPLKSNSQTINPFKQPNDTTLNYYGSGDLNADNIVDKQEII